jgi:hypothetical protein
MSAHPLHFAAAAATALLLLTACGPTDLVAAPSETPEPSPSSSSGDPDGLIEVPDDAVLIVEGVATAANGAVANVRMFVHAPAPYDADIAGDAVLATEAWCAGEVDISVFAAQDYSFTDVDYSMALAEGSVDWPQNTPILLLPLPWPDTTIAPSGEPQSIDAATLPGQPESGIPHCLQPVLSYGPGEGTIYLGIAGDKLGTDGGVPFTAWANHKYGFNANLPGTLPPAPVTFSECSSSLTPLGEDLGAPTAQWQERFETAFCVVGGATGGE